MNKFITTPANFIINSVLSLTGQLSEPKVAYSRPRVTSRHLEEAAAYNEQQRVRKLQASWERDMATSKQMTDAARFN